MLQIKNPDLIILKARTITKIKAITKARIVTKTKTITKTKTATIAVYFIIIENAIVENEASINQRNYYQSELLFSLDRRFL